jgi:hypothetical protein
VMLLLELTRPGVLGHPTDGAVQSLVTGLADHSGALVAGYVLALVTLGVRQRFLRSEPPAQATPGGRPHGRAQSEGPHPTHRPSALPAQATNRSGSPAPTRTTSG